MGKESYQLKNFIVLQLVSFPLKESDFLLSLLLQIVRGWGIPQASKGWGILLYVIDSNTRVRDPKSVSAQGSVKVSKHLEGLENSGKYWAIG